MKKRKTAAILLLILMGVFLLMSTPYIWKWVYPIKYEAEVQTAAKRFQVDPFLLLAIIRTESNFNSNLTSKKGAIGLMQVMPKTADWVISQASFDPMAKEYLDTPKVNIDIGTWYVSYLMKRYDGDLVLTIAAYNAGPGSVNTWIKNQRWDGRKETLEDIPFGETRHYVQRVLYYHKRYQEIYQSEFTY
ncbi:lytic transglycosylase domain-containing protein [Brevibacillus ginsengisoli]|uniref:lytic transglycosylase domain-containing protein n=1 Tax=Brevibacillus ginsengisoli TaxID=363854 RepID=UPI003CED90C1